MNREDTMNQAEDAMVPELRAHDGITGAPVRLADGQEWLLADGGLWNGLDELRDAIDDAARLRGEVPMADIRRAAFVLLKANYRLEDAEAAVLVMEADPQELADAAGSALFGTAAGRKTYTMWAYSAMLANGLDPAKIPVAVHPHVLSHLVATGRAIPADKFIDSAVAGSKMAAFRARAARSAPPAPAPEPES